MIHCPNCKRTAFFASPGNKFCFKCGTEMVPSRGVKFTPRGAKTVSLPKCNWCHRKLMPFMDYCPKCGKIRNDALNKFPPTPVSPPPSEPKSFYETVLTWSRP